MFVDEVGKGEENPSGGHDEGANNRIHKAHYQDKQKGRVHLYTAFMKQQITPKT